MKRPIMLSMIKRSTGCRRARNNVYEFAPGIGKSYLELQNPKASGHSKTRGAIVNVHFTAGRTEISWMK